MGTIVPHRLLELKILPLHVANGGFPGGSDGKESPCNVGDPASIPGSRSIPWRGEWLSTLVFFPGEFHGQRSLVSYSPRGRRESDTTEH